MTTPKRIQRKRTKGWRMPEGAIYVGRGSRWGNPWKVGEQEIIDLTRAGFVNLLDGGVSVPVEIKTVTPEYAVQRYRELVHASGQGAIEAMRAQLRGRDLLCWCALDQPCHAGVLLEIANR